MKARTLILMAAAAVLVVACKTKTVEEKLAEFNEWNETFMENYRTRLTALQDDEEAAEAGIQAVWQFCREMGIPEYLDDVGVDKAKVPAMAITALEDGVGATNPRKTTVSECEQVFYRCFRK